jgi:hypothetical integral membrane protein (TIGR02206 family)
MFEGHFQSGSTTHVTALVVCLSLIVTTLIASARSSGRTGQEAIRSFIGWGCLLVWTINASFWLFPERFEWARSLPLQICNLANLVGAMAVLKRHRLSQGILYFWALGLCIWAVVTPTLDMGPAKLGFWIFWVYHLFIGLAAAFLLGAEKFRPDLSDLSKTIVFTLGYVAILFLVNWGFNWNYGFVGPTTPDVKTPVDALGPYPQRVFIMGLMGSLVFTALWLPWQLVRLITPSRK